MASLLKTLTIIFASLPILLFGLNCPLPAGDVGLGYDYFRSIPEGDWEGNTGGLVSFNIGMPIGAKKLGFQFGGSYGLYDWAGRLSSPSYKQTGLQQQLFLTTGLFRKTTYESGWNAGIVYDWMWNRDFGTLAVQTNFGQIRFQGGYLCRRTNEFGLWGTVETNRSHVESLEVPLVFRAVAQINAYWKHLFKNCATTMLWAGIPYKRSLSFSTGRAGIFIIGGSFRAPLSNRLCIDGHASYMAPHSAHGGYKQRYYAANICIELKYLFGDHCSFYDPYMSIGNNSNFITDTNISF